MSLTQILLECSERLYNDENNLDIEIDATLEKIGNYCKVDRAYTFLFDWNNDKMSNIHEWCSEGTKPEIDTLKDVNNNDYPIWIKTLTSKKHINFEDINKMPSKWKNEKELLERQDIKSILVVPMTKVNLMGFIGFDSVKETKKWTQNEIHVLEIISNIIGNVIYQKQIYKCLENKEKLLNTIFESTPASLYVKNKDLKYTKINKAFAEYIDESPDDMVGKTSYDFYNKEDADDYTNDDLDILNGEIKEGMIKSGWWPKLNKKRWVSSSKAPLYDKDGNIEGLFGVNIDITKQKEHEEKLNSILKAIPDDIFIFDKDGTYLDIYQRNPLSKDKNELIGKRVEELVPNINKEFQEIINKVVKDRTIETFRYPIEFSSDNINYFEAKVAPYEDDKVITIERNITKQRKYEKDLETLNNKLKEILSEIALQEQQHKELLDTLNECITITDENETFIYANKYANEINGVENLVGMNANDFDRPDYSNKVINEEMIKRKKGLKSTYFYTFINKHGKEITLKLTSYPRSKQKGVYTGSYNVGLDVTDLSEKDLILETVNNYSGRFLRSSSEDFKYTLESYMEKIAKITKVSCVTIYKYEKDKLNLFYDWSSIKCDPKSNNLEDELGSNLINKLLLIHSDDTHFKTNGELKNSNLFIPIIVKNNYWGCIRFECCKRKDWSLSEIQLLNIATNIIGSAIENDNNESELKKQIEFIKQLTDNIDDIIWAKDIEGRFTFANKSCKEMTKHDLIGIDNKELINYFEENGIINSLISEIDDERNKEAILKKEDLQFINEGYIGSNFYVLDIKKSPFIVNDEVIGVVGSGRDITKEMDHKIEAEIQGKLFNAVSDQLPFLVWIKDKEGRFTYVNQALVNYYKKPDKSSLLGKRVEDFEHGGELKVTTEHDRIVYETGEEVKYDYSSYVGDELRYTSAHKIPFFRGNELEGILGIGYDITEKIKKEQELKEQINRSLDTLFDEQNNEMFNKIDKLNQKINQWRDRLETDNKEILKE